MAKVAFSEGAKDLFPEEETEINDTWPETGSNNASPEPDEDNTKPLSAGAVVGRAAGIAAIAALLFFLFRKKKHSSLSHHSQTEYPPAYNQSPHSSTMAKYPPELNNDGERLNYRPQDVLLSSPSSPGIHPRCTILFENNICLCIAIFMLNQWYKYIFCAEVMLNVIEDDLNSGSRKYITQSEYPVLAAHLSKPNPLNDLSLQIYRFFATSSCHSLGL